MSQFSLTTAQLARAAGVTAEVLHSHVKRNGHWKNFTPRKQPNGRHLWPREALQACGLFPMAPVTVDIRAIVPWLEERAIPSTDVVAEAVAVALAHPRIDSGRPPVAHVEDAFAVAALVKAHAERLRSDPRLSGAERHDGELALARALAPVWSVLPDAVIAQAQRELFGVEA